MGLSGNRRNCFSGAKAPGFTLAELLIALAILGVIATFTIPKVLNVQQNSQYNAIAKEAAGTIAQAYETYKLQNGQSANIGFQDMTPYLNYVRVTSICTLDDRQTLTTRTCDASHLALFLHNGAMIWYNTSDFTGTEPTRSVEILLDPDGKVTDGTTNGPGKSIQFFLYYDGHLLTRGDTIPNTWAAGSTYASPNPTFDPPWFSW